MSQPISPTPPCADHAQALAILDGSPPPAPTIAAEKPKFEGEYGGVRVSIFDRRPASPGDDLIDCGPW